jgi:hypothetical protein
VKPYLGVAFWVVWFSSNVLGESANTSTYGGLELTALAFPTPDPPLQQELHLGILPILGWNPGEDFALEFGGKFQFRVLRSRDGGWFRYQDWAELSDYGQVVRLLRAGSDASPVQLRLGAFETQTLGAGHLINRYSNRANPNYHPGGGTLTAYFGPSRTELLVSDFLGARIFAGEERLDLGSIFGGSFAANTVFASASIAHDAAAAAGHAKSITLGYADATVAFYKASSFQAFANGGIGVRLGVNDTDAGGSIGLGADAYLYAVRLSWKAELRFQGGSFEHGLIGPVYELSRFSSVGLRQLGLADERLPHRRAFYGEVSVTSGASKPQRLALTAGVHRFFWGRTDADVILSGSFGQGGSPVLAVRFSGVGMGQIPRYSVGAQLRVRFSQSFYGVGDGGTLYFPQSDNSLFSAWFASAGIGLDFEG